MGHFSSPWEFPPLRFAGKGRFDGPPKRFRTLYCSGSVLTCLRETLAFLRPPLRDLLNPSKGRAVVPLDWKQKNVLVQAEVEISSGEICLLDDLILRRDLRLKLASDLLKLGIEHLDMDTLQGPKRKLTQAITRELFEEGAAGIAYRSKYDSEICGALFEGRARLVPRGEAIPLTGSFEELEQVCREFSLTLEPGL